MASKWINKDLFNKLVEKKKNEKDKPAGSGTRRSELAWRNPDKGTEQKPRIYVGRFLPDPKGQFYKEYYYHMFKVGEQWTFFLCPKTYHMENFCPWCSATSHLYMGTKADKDMAYNLKRKSKFAANWFVIDDPRDAETQNSEDTVAGKVRVYEFPSKVEKKIKEQITDDKNGLGSLIFDPGEDGFDFILKVSSTRKDARGREFPDYSLSEFGRKPYAIAGSEKEIETIMNTTIDLDEYIKSMERDEEDVIAALKQMMLWDLVSVDMKKSKGIKEEKKVEKVEEEIPDFDAIRKNKEEDKADPPFDTVNEGEEDLSDEALLRELEDL